jgi:hypothetical protein
VKAPVKTPTSVPAVTLKSKASAPASQAKLMQLAQETARGLLETSPRVLVVYGDDGARLYCEEASEADSGAAGSPADAEQEEPASASASARRRR